MTDAILEERPSSRIRENPLRERHVIVKRYGQYLLAGVLLSAMAYHVFVIETDWERMGSFGDILSTTAEFAPNMAFFPVIIGPLFETLLMAFWGTFLAMILAFPVVWLAARNISPWPLVTYPLGRVIIVMSRSVHELIFALLFVAALGLGAFPGILALACRSIGFLSKTTAEAIENVERGPIEAIEATGANRLSVIIFGIVPQVFPIFVGNVIFRLDIAAKDVGLAIETAAAAGVDVPLTQAAGGVYEAAIDAGDGGLVFHATLRELERRAGVELEPLRRPPRPDRDRGGS